MAIVKLLVAAVSNFHRLKESCEVIHQSVTADIVIVL